MATEGFDVRAQDYNNLRNKVFQVLGSGGTNPNTGSADTGFGYGQTLVSEEVAPYQTVGFAHMNNLRSDIIKVRKHQTGAVVSLPSFSLNSSISASEFNKFITEADNGVTNRFVIADDQGVIETRNDSPTGSGSVGGIISQRTNSWNTVLTHEVRVTFRTATSARYFFNAGGQLRITPSLSNTSDDTKNKEWRTLLNETVKEVRFNYNQTVCIGSGGGTTNIGFYGLTTSYAIVYQKAGTPNYSQSVFTIRAKTNNNRDQVLFEITFDDGEVDESYFAVDEYGTTVYYPRPDESVIGRLSSEITQFRPTGSDNTFVIVEGPIAYNNLLTIG